MPDSEKSPTPPVYFVDVLLPLALPQLFTYKVPADLLPIMQPGLRAVVQFGKRKIMTGLVRRLHQNEPQYFTKDILELLDDEPLVNKYQLALFDWISDYYMCTSGEVMKVALPTALKLGSESRIEIHPEQLKKPLPEDLSDREDRLMQKLEQEASMTFDQVATLLEIKSVQKLIKNLSERQLIIIYEQVKEKYKPRIIKRVRLSDQFAFDKKQLAGLLKAIQKKEKQSEILMAYMRFVPVYKQPGSNEKGMEKSLLKEHGSPSSLNTLIKNGILEEFEEVVSRFETIVPENLPENLTLSPEQTQARDQLLDVLPQKKVALLHGVTGSGKTEIYIDLIHKTLESGSQVLFLLPEIALTTQIVARLQKVFGSQLGVYHSKFSDNERVELWRGVATGRYSFVVGVRSSVFLPFDNLGLIIVDEEHEPSYKQFDPAPRYHARDTAIWLAHKHQAYTLLGSATPSIETYYNASSGRWGLVSLLVRYGDAQMPDIQTIDLKEAKRLKRMKQEFSDRLLQTMKSTLEKGQQVILFQNRRGYSPFLNCQDCGWIPHCANCSVTLTYHQYNKALICHYCGFTEWAPAKCAECGSTKVKTVGYGTEKLEDELKILLPEANTARMDLDTTRNKGSYQQIINDFAIGDIDILIGTQMVSKGLDFDKVTLVGVFDADRLIHFPDFRSHERTFQLITQVSGRAGRRQDRGLVLIQTSNPEQPLLIRIAQGDYAGFYEQEIAERESYQYPPFTRLIRLTVRHEEALTTEKSAKALVAILTQKLGVTRVLGPQQPLVNRIRNRYLMHILIKVERKGSNLRAIKDFITKSMSEVVAQARYKNVQVIPDVDPA